MALIQVILFDKNVDSQLSLWIAEITYNEVTKNKNSLKQSLFFSFF